MEVPWPPNLDTYLSSVTLTGESNILLENINYIVLITGKWIRYESHVTLLGNKAIKRIRF